MSFRKYGNTDYQETKLAQVEKLANKLKFRLVYGTSIGKSPQSVVLDHKYQDGIIHVSSDSDWGISYQGESNVSFAELKKLMLATLAEEQK